MKYKVGDKVKVRKDLSLKRGYGHNDLFDVNETMAKLCGETVTIECVFSTCYHICEMGYQWTDDMFENIA